MIIESTKSGLLVVKGQPPSKTLQEKILQKQQDKQNIREENSKLTEEQRFEKLHSTYKVVPFDTPVHKCGDNWLKYKFIGEFSYDDIDQDGWHLNLNTRDDDYWDKITYCPWCGTNLDTLEMKWKIINIKHNIFGVMYSLSKHNVMGGHSKENIQVFDTKELAEEKLLYIKEHGVCEHT